MALLVVSSCLGVLAAQSRVNTARAAVTNYVPNPDVESFTNGVPTSWTDSTWGNNTHTASVVTPGHGGAGHALRQDVTAYTDGSVYWNSGRFSVTPGQTFDASIWYQSNVTTDVNVRFINSDGTTVNWFVTRVGPSSDWAQAKGTFVVPANVVTAQIFQFVKAVGYLVTDDYSVTVGPAYDHPMVSVTMDDAWDSQFTTAWPTLSANQIPATFYVPSGELNTSGYMTSSQVQQLYAAGNQIASHTITHPDLTSLTPDQLDYQLKQSQIDLQNLTGAPVLDFAYPFGKFNPAVEAACLTYYRSCRNTEYGLSMPDQNRGELVVQYLHTTTTLAEFQSWVSWAKASNTWLVLVYHAVVPNPTDTFNITPQSFSDQMAYLHSTGIATPTVASALATMGSIDTTAPTTSITSPANGTTVAAGAVSVTAAASDDRGVSSVDLLVDGAKVGTAVQAPYTFTWNASVGSHTLTSVAHDSAGNTGSSPPVSVQAADGSPPTPPPTLSAGNVTARTVDLTWGAATDNVAVTGYEIVRNGVVLPGTVTGLSVTDTGLNPSTSYTYTVRAFDGAGNVSTDSPPTTVTTLATTDTTAPTAPSALNASNTTAQSVDLAWPAATDNVGVTGYRLIRNGTMLPMTLSGLTYTDSGLTPGAGYSYTVRAVDAAGNLSTDSPSVAVSLPYYLDTWTGTSGSPWSTAWTAAQSNGIVDVQNGTGRLLVNDVLSAYARAQLTGVTAQTDTDLLFSYQLTATGPSAYLDVYLRGSGGWQNSYRPHTGYGIELSTGSGTISILRNVNDALTTLQMVSGGQQVTTATQWMRVRVVGSTIQLRTWLDGQAEPTTWKATVTDSAIAKPGQLYLALNRSSTNVGVKSVLLDNLRLSPGSTTSADTVAPGPPTFLTAGNATTTTVDLSWGAATDNVGVTGYQVVRNGTVLPGTVTGLTYTDTGLTPATSYTYTVRALDAAGNVSPDSPPATITTTAAPDTTAPTAPPTLTAGNATTTTVDLSWGAATDNVGVTGYQVVRNGTALPGTVTGLTYTDTGLTPGTSYTYTVRALDAAGNVSPDSPPATVTTTAAPDTTAPTAPPTLTAGNATTTTVDLSWGAATDNVGVTGYQVVRNGTALPGTVTGLTYTDTGLTPSTTYTYTVRALDAAGNVSPSSPPASISLPFYLDGWTNPNGSPWASAWTTSQSNGAVDTQNGLGRLLFNDVAAAYARAQLTGVPAQTNTDLLLSYQWNGSGVGTFGVYLRGSGGWQNSLRPNTGYGIELTSSSGSVAVVRNVNGALTTLQTVSGAQQVTTATQWLRLRVSGSTIQFRTWRDGQAEPTKWKATLTDTAITAPGQLYLALNRGSGKAGSKAVLLDNLRLSPVTP